MANRATLEHTRIEGRGYKVSWVGGAWELIDWVQKHLGDDWRFCKIIESTLPPEAEKEYEQCRQLALRPTVPTPPVVEQLPVEREWTLPKEPYRRYADHNAPSLTADESWAADVPHNYVTGIGDVFDWCDGETKERIRMAIEAEAEADWINDDEIDLGDMRRGPWLNKVFRLRKLRRKVMERAA